MGRIGAEGSVPLDASRRRCLRGTDEWVRRSHHEGGVAWCRRRGVRPSAPPDADASLAPTSGFDAATTRAALSGVGAEGSYPRRLQTPMPPWHRRLGSTQPPRRRLCLVSAPRGPYPRRLQTPMPPWHRRVGSTQPPRGRRCLVSAPRGPYPRRLQTPMPPWHRRVGSTQPPRGRLCLVSAPRGPSLDASRRRCLLGTDEWVRRSHHKGGFAWCRRRGVRPSAPPDADASLAPTSGFDAATTRAALPGFGAEGSVPSTPPDADASLAPTSGFGVVDPKVTKPEPGTGVISTSASARVATVFLILRKPVPWRKRRMASSGRGAPLPRRALWPGP